MSLRDPEVKRAYVRSWFNRLQNKGYTHLNKVKVLAHYSNPIGMPICNNCGERDIDVLCLDHIDGGGRKQRLKLYGEGTELFSWLIKNNYPEGYQVLCANCNMRKMRKDRSLNGN